MHYLTFNYITRCYNKKALQWKAFSCLAELVEAKKSIVTLNQLPTS